MNRESATWELSPPPGIRAGLFAIVGRTGIDSDVPPIGIEGEARALREEFGVPDDEPMHVYVDRGQGRRFVGYLDLDGRLRRTQ